MWKCKQCGNEVIECIELECLKCGGLMERVIRKVIRQKEESKMCNCEKIVATFNAYSNVEAERFAKVDDLLSVLFDILEGPDGLRAIIKYDKETTFEEFRTFVYDLLHEHNINLGKLWS